MPTLQTLSGFEPVTLAEAKLAARVDVAELDGEIGGLITAAREQAEQITGRRYRPQVLRESLADWPALPIAVHAATACAISYWTAGSTWATLAPSAYVFAPAGACTVVVPALGSSWPVLGAVAAGPRVRIDLTAGPAAPAEVPESVKTYIKASVAAWVKDTEALIDQRMVANPMFDRLLDAERLWA